MLCLRDRPSLDDTLGLFAAGVDDVCASPCMCARFSPASAPSRAATSPRTATSQSAISRVYFDGREVEVRGEALPLPRRERRILECLVRNRGRRLSKSQIFNAVYGIFDEDVDENVVESHISKLRKKLKYRLGYDPIDSKRFLGYCLKRPGGED